MIEKIKSLSSSDGWKKPWFTEGSMQWPKNLSGREYNGMNALMLMMHCEKKGYKLPVFMTFDRVAALNFQKDKQGKRNALLDDKGEPLPHVGVNKGEKSFPVFITTFTCIDKDTKEKIKYDDYKLMSDEDKKNVNVYPKMQVYNVFNVSQTNLQEARPELYAKLEAENQVVKAGIEGDEYSFPPMDKMIKEQRWICPINVLHQDNAYYSISKDAITVPEKSQFKDGESFYTNLWHEMAHSSGSEKYLNRLKPSGGFGSAEYSKEELIAELSSALVSSRYGLTKNLKEDSAAYLKSWLDNIKESPDFIKTVLMDVKRASSMITQRVDEIALEIDNAQEQHQEQANAVTKESEKAPEQKVFYTSVQYLQTSDDTQKFDGLTPEQILQEAREYDNGDAIDLENTHATAKVYPHDDIIAEDDQYAVVCNNSVGGTIDILRKVSEQEVRDMIDRYGMTHDATDDVKAVAKDMVREQFEELSKDKMLAIEKPNGEVVYFQYNQDSDKIEVGNYTNSGMMVDFSVPYDHDFSLDANLQNLNDLISEQTTQQVESSEEERISAKLPPVSFDENPNDEIRAALDNFMTDYYWDARRYNHFRMMGYETYQGKTALRLQNDEIRGHSYYLVTLEKDNGQKGMPNFFMHLYDPDIQKEIFKSRPMPADRDDARSFLRGAYKELESYEFDKKEEQKKAQQERSEYSSFQADSSKLQNVSGMKLDARNIISLSKYVALYQNSENLWGIMSTKHSLPINLPEWDEVKLDEVGNVYLKQKGSLDFPLAFSIHDMKDLNDVLEKYDRLEVLEDKETHQKIMQAVVNKDADTAVKLQAPLSQEECEALDNGEISHFEMANEKFEEKLTSLLDPEWEEEEQEVEEQQTRSGMHR